VLEQSVALGVTVTVRVAVPSYLRTDCAEPVLQTLLEISAVVSVLRRLLPGAVIWIDEPDRRTKLKDVSSFTVKDCTTALEPDTLRVMPPKLKTTSVVSVTSLYAARASEGATSNAIAIPARTSIRCIVSLFN
jgi:hypothetical protein